MNISEQIAWVGYTLQPEIDFEAREDTDLAEGHNFHFLINGKRFTMHCTEDDQRGLSFINGFLLMACPMLKDSPHWG